MGKMLTIRDVDEEVYRKFREKSIAERQKLGRALTQAMKEWLRKENKKERLDPRNLIKITGIIKTKRKVKWSEEIDEFLYGFEK